MQFFSTQDSSDLVRDNAGMTVESELPTFPDPPGSRIQFHRPDNNSCVFRLSGAGIRSTFLLVFSLQWLGLQIFASVVVDGFWQSGPMLVASGIMFIVGLGLLGWWFQSCFQKLLILVERDRIVVKRDLLGWGRVQEIELDADSRADLVGAHDDSESPDFRIEVRGTNGSVRFGDGLFQGELNWIVDSINECLGAEADPLKDQRAELRDTILAQDAPKCVTIEVETRECLRLRMPAAATTSAKAGGIILVLTLVMIIVFVGVEFDWHWTFYAFPTIACLLMAPLVISATTILELNGSELRQISAIGPFRVTLSVATDDIVSIDAQLNNKHDRRARLENIEQWDHNCVALVSTRKQPFFLWMAKQRETTWVAERLQQMLNHLRKES